MGSFSQGTRLCVLPPSPTPEQPAALAPQTMPYRHHLSEMMGCCLSQDMYRSRRTACGTGPPDRALHTSAVRHDGTMPLAWHNLAEQPVTLALNRALKASAVSDDGARHQDTISRNSLWHRPSTVPYAHQLSDMMGHDIRTRSRGTACGTGPPKCALHTHQLSDMMARCLLQDTISRNSL